MKKKIPHDQKTKAELIDDINDLSQQIEKLESELKFLKSKIKNNPKSNHPRSPRREIYTDIEFIADFDIVKAKGLNISEGGIAFELTEDLLFEMRFELEGEIHNYRAHLVWAKRLPGGGYRLGLRFVDSESSYPIF